MDFPLAKLEKHLGKEGKAPALIEKTTTVSPNAGVTKSSSKSIIDTPISRRTLLKSAAGQALQGMMPESLISSPGVAGLVESAVEAAPTASFGRSAIPGLMAKLMRQGMSPEEAGREVEKMIPNILIGWPEMVGERIAAPADRLPFIGKESPLMSIFGEMVKPASQRGPYSLRPEMRGLRELSPEDYELLKQTARDVKEYGFESERAFAGGGRVKKTVQQMADELMTKGTKVVDKPDLARRSLFGLKAQPAMDFPLARIDDKALTRLEKEFGKEGKAPTLTEKTTTVSPDAGATKSTLKSITETPLSRRTVLKSAAGQAMQSMLPMDELAKLADIPAAATPVGAMAQAARAAPALPVTVESVLAAAMNRGLKKQEAIDVAAARFPEFDFNEIEDRWRVLKDPYRQIGEHSDDADVDLLEMSRPAENMRGIIGAPMSGPLMATRPYMRALKEASPRIYGKAREFSKDAAESSLEGMIDRGLLQGDDEIARFLRNDPSIYDLMGQR
jgi:hypothetical protein